MKKCPACERDADVLITNVQDGSQFCPACAPASFMPHYVLTISDVLFLKSCGINPELSPVLMDLMCSLQRREV